MKKKMYRIFGRVYRRLRLRVSNITNPCFVLSRRKQHPGVHFSGLEVWLFFLPLINKELVFLRV